MKKFKHSELAAPLLLVALVLSTPAFYRGAGSLLYVARAETTFDMVIYQ